jgi:hypothetical protein
MGREGAWAFVPVAPQPSPGWISALSAAESGHGNSGYKDEGKTAENAICLSSEATYTSDMSE